MNMDEGLFICDYKECFHLTVHVHDINCDTTCSCYCSSKCVDFLVLQRREKLDKLGRSSLIERSSICESIIGTEVLG